MKGIEEFTKRWDGGAEVPGIVKKVDERNSDGGGGREFNYFQVGKGIIYKNPTFGGYLKLKAVRNSKDGKVFQRISVHCCRFGCFIFMRFE